MAPPFPTPKFFSPEGRLYQVEYAIEGVASAGACVGILAKQGIVLAAEIENRDPLLDLSMGSGRIYRVDQNNACVVAGNPADGIKLVKIMSKISQCHKNAYGEIMPTERLVERICQKKQAYTMYGGKRPFGISVLYMGWDSRSGFQLYQSDPSGIYTGWRSNCIGRNSRRAQDFLSQELCGKPKPALLKAVQLAIRVLEVAMDGRQMTGASVQISTLERIDNECYFQNLAGCEIQELCRLHYNRLEFR